MKKRKIFGGLALMMLGISLSACATSGARESINTSIPANTPSNEASTSVNPSTSSGELVTVPSSSTGTIDASGEGAGNQEGTGNNPVDNTQTGGENQVNPINNGGGTPVVTTPEIVINNGTDNLQLLSCSGDQESLYAEFKPVTNADSYKAYVKGNDSSSYTEIDPELIRLYKDSNSEYYYRCDAVGLKAGTYSMKIVPVIGGAAVDSKGNEVNNITVISYDRTGFAFSTSSPLNGGSIGAYKLDGTLKDNAEVIYLTESNKNTVTMDIKGTTYTGINNITGQFKKKNNTTPLAIRILGKLTIDNLVCEDLKDWYCLGIKEGSDLTIEGIGNDATMYGVGVGCNKSSSVEFRNLGFIEWGLPNADADAIQFQGSTNIWAHDNDIFYGHKQSGDQAKGDGSCDLKDDSKFVTISYNHFWDSGKMSLCGMKKESGENYISYHHNWFDHSDSRHPRIRTMTVHVYNNYYDGNSKYGIGAVLGAQCFAESNYFRNCKYPFLIGAYGTDKTFSKTMFSDETKGFIKAYNNTISGATRLAYANANAGVAGATDDGLKDSSDAYLASTRGEIISNEYSNGVGYSNFDTNGSVDLGVLESQIQSPEDAVDTIKNYSGRVQGGDFKYEFDNSVADQSYDIDTTLANKLISYKTSLVKVQGIEGTNQSGNNDPVVVSGADDVIALINALPEASAVTEANRVAINSAKSAYDALSTEDKAKVTNYSKLEACIAALPHQVFTTQRLTFKDGATGDNSFFTVSGNLKSNFAGLTYDGVNYTSALKMESSTTIKFTADCNIKITIVCDSSTGKIKFGDQEVAASSGVITKTLNLTSSKEITISKKDSMNVALVIVEAA